MRDDFSQAGEGRWHSGSPTSFSTVANQLDDFVTQHLLPACVRMDNAWNVAMQDDALIGAIASPTWPHCDPTRLKHRQSCALTKEGLLLEMLS